jgi:hypothetical protein
MVALSRQVDRRDTLVAKRERIVEETKALFDDHEAGTFTGRGNTKQDVQDRISFYEDMLVNVAGE